MSQTITRGGPRTQIAIPAQGMIEFRDALTDLLEEYGTEDGGFKGDLPEGRYMRVDSKNFYFDIGQNNRGIYMRISEVRCRVKTYYVCIIIQRMVIRSGSLKRRIFRCAYLVGIVQLHLKLKMHLYVI